MDLNACYKILNVSPAATDEEIKKSFKNLAHKYHPDKNRDNLEWANKIMSALNKAYTDVMQYRFTYTEDIKKETAKAHKEREKEREAKEKAERTERIIKKQKDEKVFRAWQARKAREEERKHEILTAEFVKIKESVKDMLYRYFQYGLYNLARRVKPENKYIFDEIVLNLRIYYHSLTGLSNKTGDKAFLHHFDTFKSMIFNFYMASECINVVDSFTSDIDYEAYVLFKEGDDILHPAEKEIFYDRHNRGFFKKEIAESLLLEGEQFLSNSIDTYPNSTWTVEAKIKLKYILSLEEYVRLFFSEDDN